MRGHARTQPSLLDQYGHHQCHQDVSIVYLNCLHKAVRRHLIMSLGDVIHPDFSPDKEDRENTTLSPNSLNPKCNVDGC